MMPGTLTRSPADIVRKLLIDLTLGSNGGASWPVFTDAEPNSPDECITVRDTQGRDGGRDMVTAERAEHHGVQIRVRAGTHAAGYTKARAIAVALDRDVYQEMVVVAAGAGGSYKLHAITRTTDVIPLGKDVPGSKRSLFTLNALVSLRSA